ncbi:MAG TPA: cupin domain-containing protein [Mycobacteriales bacterium]|nr:cupin domain-containing protein [Mycobacteriales bacterium]
MTRTVFTATAESTGGAYVEIEVTYPPGNTPPPLHKHPSQTETFTVLSGQLDGVRAGTEFSVGAGEELVVETGTPHTMGAGAGGAVFRWRTIPALRTGELFCALWQVAHDNDWKPAGMQLFGVLAEFDAEFCLC